MSSGLAASFWVLADDFGAASLEIIEGAPQLIAVAAELSGAFGDLLAVDDAFRAAVDDKIGARGYFASRARNFPEIAADLLTPLGTKSIDAEQIQFVAPEKSGHVDRFVGPIAGF